MKLFGYVVNKPNDLATLKEVTLQVDSGTLRRVARFLEFCADQMDSEPDWEHEHFRDWTKSNLSDEDSDIIVFRADDQN